MKIPSIFDEEFQTMCAAMVHLTGFQLTYTPESLSDMELLIDEMFPDPNASRMNTTFLPFGWYLGEVIVRNVPGTKWEDNKEDFWQTAIVSETPHGTAKMLPFVRVEKFFFDRTDGLKVFYDVALMNSVGMLGVDIEDAPTGEWSEWQDKPFGRIRFMTAEGPKEEGQ